MKSEKHIAEICRYLGVPNPDAETIALATECAELLAPHAEARFVHRLAEITVSPGGVQMLGREFPGRGLSAHLSGCSHAVLFAMTLGAGVDRLIARHSHTGIAKAAVLQAAAAALVEDECDGFCDSLAKQAKSGALTGKPAYLTARFSPGYGDLPLSCQKDVLALLNAPVRIGLTATESYMLAPSKSVTAFMGLSPVPVLQCYGACEMCGKTDCPFRKNQPSPGATI